MQGNRGSDDPSDRTSLPPVERALLDLREAMVDQTLGAPIALIGMAVRLPGGASTPSEYWRLLLGERRAVGPAGPERHAPDDPTAGIPGAFLDRIDGFDRDLFGIAPRHAARLDPRHRLLLELSWEALEQAGYAPDRVAGLRTGLFLGCGRAGWEPGEVSAAGWIGELLDARGPTVGVEADAASSLVAIHQACHSLRQGEADLVLAGGLDLILSRPPSEGPPRGEGGAVVVMRRLDDAVEHGDALRALLRGSALNRNGRDGSDPTSCAGAWRDVVESALRAANVRPADVEYVELDGTAAAIAEPAAARALGESLGGPDRSSPAIVSGVAGNLGSLGPAAGAAGLVKICLALENEEIPPDIAIREPGERPRSEIPRIRWAETRLAWRRRADRRLAAVACLGRDGTNACLVIEEAPPDPAIEAASRNRRVLTLSAATETALTELAGCWADRIDELPDGSIDDVCFTANSGRARLPLRLAVVAEDRRRIVGRLRAVATREPEPPGVFRGPEGPKADADLAFLFAGHGSQYAGMGRGLYRKEGQFRDWLDRCDSALRPLLQASLIDLVFADGARAALLDRPEYALPALFSVEYALARLWQTWGARPAAVLGHGVGEYAAACVAGVLELDDAIELVALHGQALQERLEAGDATAASEALAACADRARYAAPRIPILCSRTGEPVTDEMSRPEYWRSPEHQPIRFPHAMRRLGEMGLRRLLEIAPQPTLLGPGEDGSGARTPLLPSLRRGVDDQQQVLETLARLHVLGATIDWKTLDRRERPRRIALPTYPFQRKRCWPASEAASRSPTEVSPAHRWSRVLHHAGAQSEQGPLELSPRSFPGKWQALDRLAVAFESHALRELGVFERAGERVTPGGLLERLGIYGTYEHLIGRWLRRLAQEGLLRQEGDSYVAEEPLPRPSLDPLLDQAREQFGDYPQLLRYVERCGRHLPPVLRGEISPMETLFPGGSFELAEDLYEIAPPARYFNEIVRAAVEGFVAAFPSDRPLRAVELGGGFCGPTSYVLRALPVERTDYLFTDTSEASLDRAAEKLRGFPNLRCGRLDIQRPPVEQGLEAGTFDLAIAAHVLHSTRDLRRAVAHTRSLLAPGGMLIVLETIPIPTHFDISVGLVEGWQSFDDGLRVDHPLVAPHKWERLLQNEGFAHTAVLPRDGSTVVLGQCVVAALASTPGAERRDKDTESVESGRAPDEVATVTAAHSGDSVASALSGQEVDRWLLDQLPD